MLFLFYSILGIILFYFSFLLSAVRGNNTVDADYLSASMVIESEKEVGSIDDLLTGIFVIIHLFG